MYLTQYSLKEKQRSRALRTCKQTCRLVQYMFRHGYSYVERMSLHIIHPLFEQDIWGEESNATTLYAIVTQQFALK